MSAVFAATRFNADRFAGLFVPLITPFRDGQVDYAAAQNLVAHLLKGGIDGLVICGTTGEAATLNEGEQTRLLMAVREVSGELPLVMGLAGNDTQCVAKRAAALSALADGLLVSAPYYVRPSQAGLLAHFNAVSAATPLPIVLYNIPYRTGVNIELPTLQKLAANPQFVAIKESGGGNMPQLLATIAETPLRVLGGEDALILLTACAGGHGAIAAAAHIRPDLYRRMLSLVAAGDLAAARAISQALAPWVKLLFSEPNPAPIKAVLAMQGLIRNELRLPMLPVTQELQNQLETLLPRILAL
ncbi:4-hydroxy-tetrahydrodipicolinate synthase [Amantichitinum ursilacus]|uniref:4-hydroxy-tetrahydrodipicolinate synthase n=1 Tax=Amantichitinum ursilacus TaxID=857265 RepID=A0A0N0GP27_9NEIS|nr:4-hydroxy-tetrahydrodipicolinate synthase [Amantichitinum ursilacus]KPC53306.1 4-hydroxy-tetrahydrodipicolinate synthase [Amantichitinum ursilacus]